MYIKIEVTIGGWIVTFLTLVREGGPSSGYVSTGFSLTLGRVVMVEADLTAESQMGAVNAIYSYALVAIFFQLIVWLVPSFTAVSVSVFGILLGPMYLIAVNHVARVLPRHLVNGTVGWMAACGAGGGALLLFITGTMASNLGIGSLQTLLLVMMIILGLVWGFVPKRRKMTLDDF